MRIATDNKIQFSNVTDYSGGAAELLSDSFDQFLSANFSDRTVIRRINGDIQLQIDNDQTLDYVWFAGLQFSGGGGTVTVNCGGYTETYAPMLSGYAYWFDMSDIRPNGDITIDIVLSGTNTVSISNIMAGESTEVVNGGVTGGQKLPAYMYNRKSVNTIDEYGNPTGNITKNIKPSMSLNIPNIERNTVFFNDIEDFYTLMAEYGHAPVYEQTDPTNYRYQSYGLFAPSSDNMTFDNRTNSLIAWSLSARACF